MINQLSKQIYENAKAHGFHEGEINVAEQLCLIHSEVSEALEADRKNHYAKDFNERMKQISDSYNGEITQQEKDKDFKLVFTNTVKNSFEDELADIMIRVMDLAAIKGVDLEHHIKLKMKYNSMRERLHGKRY